MLCNISSFPERFLSLFLLALVVFVVRMFLFFTFSGWMAEVSLFVCGICSFAHEIERQKFVLQNEQTNERTNEDDDDDDDVYVDLKAAYLYLRIVEWSGRPSNKSDCNFKSNSKRTIISERIECTLNLHRHWISQLRILFSVRRFEIPIKAFPNQTRLSHTPSPSLSQTLSYAMAGSCLLLLRQSNYCPLVCRHLKYGTVMATCFLVPGASLPRLLSFYFHFIRHSCNEVA